MVSRTAQTAFFIAFMRRVLAVMVCVTATFVVTAIASVTTPASAAAGASGAKSFLFTVEASNGRTTPMKATGSVDERFRLTLSDVDPVTMFADWPFRNAKFISPSALDANWSTWFVSDPPNEVLTFARPGKVPGSMVVTLTNPRYQARDRRKHDPLEKGANWQRLTTPRTFSGAGLFIDEVGADPLKEGYTWSQILDGEVPPPFFFGSIQNPSRGEVPQQL
jgi:hypothetical protein